MINFSKIPWGSLAALTLSLSAKNHHSSIHRTGECECFELKYYFLTICLSLFVSPPLFRSRPKPNSNIISLSPSLHKRIHPNRRICFRKKYENIFHICLTFAFQNFQKTNSSKLTDILNILLHICVLSAIKNKKIFQFDKKNLEKSSHLPVENRTFYHSPFPLLFQFSLKKMQIFVS